MLWSILFGFMFHSTPPCQYEDGSELKQHQVCSWDGGENSFIAINVTKSSNKYVHMEYIYVDGHVEYSSWPK